LRAARGGKKRKKEGYLLSSLRWLEAGNEREAQRGGKKGGRGGWRLSLPPDKSSSSIPREGRKKGGGHGSRRRRVLNHKGKKGKSDAASFPLFRAGRARKVRRLKKRGGPGERDRRVLPNRH